MNLHFSIQDTKFEVAYNINDDIIDVASVPTPYQVTFVNQDSFEWISNKIKSSAKTLILIDKKIKNKILTDINFDSYPVYEVEAVEINKNIEQVLKVCDFLTDHGANRGSMVYVIGGGILQDIGAFACAMYKRGIPWTFIPTTLLSQADSCLGGKTAVNFKKTKNVLGLFSAPNQVLIDTNFLKTLNTEETLSGIGEIFRLLITGGTQTFAVLDQHIDSLAKLNTATIQLLMKHSLNVKRAIVEHDEFELDIRRSMNYGHSIGHALEAASGYAVPHGQAVTIGILVENQLAYNQGLLDKHQLDKIKELGVQLISNRSKTFLSMFNASLLFEYLVNDKKAVGKVLKVATIENIGSLKFIDLGLDQQGQQAVVEAFYEVFQK
jgi:3-dehydroquinate synthase